VRRVSHLWPALVSFENLLRASRNARRGKRSWPNVAAFEYDLEPELLTLQDDLETGRYRPGTYRTFKVHEPKERLISAAPYRDRVVHHAVLSVIEPIFEKVFIEGSHSCRKGKGTHKALDRFTHHARRHPWVLKTDISKYFPSIDLTILETLLARKIKDPRVLDLLDLIIHSSNPQEFVRAYFPGDDLFTPLTRRRGIPIGNLTSQFFANVYLDPLDHFVKEVLGAPGYLRYTDDIAVFGPDKRTLRLWRLQMEGFLARRLRLELHPRKTQVFPVDQGTDFLGFRVFPDHRKLRKSTLTSRRRKLRRLVRDFGRGGIEIDRVRASIQSWLGHAGHGDTHGLRRAVLAELRFRRGTG